MTAPFVTVAVPTLDEELTIRRVIGSLLPADDGAMELIVADGGSRDRTREIVAEMAMADSRIRLVDNPARYQSAGVNAAAKAADSRSDVLVRCDAHCSYPDGFVRRVARTLAETGASSVVVPMVTTGSDTRLQQAASIAQNSVLGNGGASHRKGAASSGWIDHGHHAAFDIGFFRGIGGYDETFAVNEDGEYDVRVHKAGGRVWMDGAALIGYHPRKTVRSLARQYFRYGQGRFRTLSKHGVRPRVRQMIPVAVTLGCAGSLALAPFCPIFALLPAAYLAACVACGLAAGKRRSVTTALMAGPAAAVMHLAWGAGFLTGAAGRILGSKGAL